MVPIHFRTPEDAFRLAGTGAAGLLFLTLLILTLGLLQAEPALTAVAVPTRPTAAPSRLAGLPPLPIPSGDPDELSELGRCVIRPCSCNVDRDGKFFCGGPPRKDRPWA